MGLLKNHLNGRVFETRNSSESVKIRCWIFNSDYLNHEIVLYLYKMSLLKIFRNREFIRKCCELNKYL